MPVSLRGAQKLRKWFERFSSHLIGLRATELANFNIVVEKWDSIKIGGKRGGSKGKQGGAKGYTTAGAGTSNTRAAAQDAATELHRGSGCGHAGCRPSGSSPDTDGGAL
jgi:hypothetical protein